MLNIVFFISLIVFFLPYTDSLVLNIGFPFKIYEVLSIILVITIFMNLLLNKKFSIKIDKQEKVVYRWLLLFWVWYCISGAFSFFILDGITIPMWATGRHALFISVITKLMYLFFNIVLFYIVINYISKKKLLIKIMRVWIISSFLISIYAVYLLLCSLVDIKPFLLLGTQSLQYGELPGIGALIIRNVTFKEGNFFGGYIVTSITMTLPFLFIKDRSINPFSSNFINFVFLLQLCALIISSSTVAVITFFIILAIFFKITFVHKLKVKKRALSAMCFAGFIAITFLFSFPGKILVFEKLLGADIHWSFSRKDRIESTITALNMAYRNPVFGVGPTNYGFFYDRYKPSNMFSGMSAKRIANNIYAEIAAESGIIGLFLFMLFLYRIRLLYIKKKKNIDNRFMPVVNGLYCGFIGMVITFFAFPTFTLTFHWVLMGLFIASIKTFQTAKIS